MCYHELVQVINGQMKIPITDQFLLDILESIGGITDFLLGNKYRQIHMLFGNENPIFKKYRKEKRKRQFNQLIYYLKRKNYINVKNLEGKKGLILTKEGFSKALAAKWIFEEKRKRKDGKWIMIVFDIPKNHSRARNLLRSILKNLGYVLFQHSVWVTPYDVSEQTEKLLQMHGLDRYVKIFLIEQLQ